METNILFMYIFFRILLFTEGSQTTINSEHYFFLKNLDQKSNSLSQQRTCHWIKLYFSFLRSKENTITRNIFPNPDRRNSIEERGRIYIFVWLTVMLSNKMLGGEWNITVVARATGRESFINMIPYLEKCIIFVRQAGANRKLFVSHFLTRDICIQSCWIILKSFLYHVMCNSFKLLTMNDSQNKIKCYFTFQHLR